MHYAPVPNNHNDVAWLLIFVICSMCDFLTKIAQIKMKYVDP